MSKWDKMSIEQKVESLADDFLESDEDVALLKARMLDMERTIRNQQNALLLLGEQVFQIEKKMNK